MLKTKNATYKGIVVITLIFLLAALVITALAAAKAGNLPIQVSCLLTFAALIYAAYYILSGYGKNAARYYKIFAGVFSLALLAALASISVNTNSYFISLFAALSLTAVLILMLGKDLGKATSLYLCAALVICCALVLIINAANQAGLVILGCACSRLILALVMTVMTVAKYIDKTARGTK